MSGDLILIVFVLITAILAVLVAKLADFWRGFTAHTRYICHEMDHADSYKEYRRWRGELRCHYLCLIPFVNEKNVMRLYRRIFRKGDHAKKEERKDSLVPLLLPSILGIFICTICVCSMTWAWYTASIETPTQKLTSACYEVTVESVMNGDSKIDPTDNVYYSLEAGISYAVTLKASGTVKECGGYCLIQNDAGDKTYTQSIMPEASITVQFKPNTSGDYTFSGVWGSLPADTVGYLKHIEPADIPIADNPAPDNTNIPAQNDPTDQPSEPSSGTYTVQSGDTLSGIAASFNTSADKLAAYNGITDKGDIKAGQVLNISPQDYEIPEPTDSQEPTPPEESDSAVTVPQSEPTPEPVSDPSADPQTEPVSDPQPEPVSNPHHELSEEATSKEEIKIAEGQIKHE